MGFLFFSDIGDTAGDNRKRRRSGSESTANGIPIKRFRHDPLVPPDREETGPSPSSVKRPDTHSYAFWGRSSSDPLRGHLAGGIRYPTDVLYRVPNSNSTPSVTPSGTLRVAVFGSRRMGEPTTLGELKFDTFNDPCSFGDKGALVDYRLFPTPMLNEPYVKKDGKVEPPTLINASSAEQAIIYANSVG